MGEYPAYLRDMEKSECENEREWAEESVREVTEARLWRAFEVTVRTTVRLEAIGRLGAEQSQIRPYLAPSGGCAENTSTDEGGVEGRALRAEGVARAKL